MSQTVHDAIRKTRRRYSGCVYVTIDPGLSTGWALWGPSGLVACGLGDPRSSPEHVIREGRSGVNDVWIERPVIYPRSKAKPNDVLTLAVGAGEWGGVYRTLVVDVHYVTPAEWKGQVPKEIHHARVWAELLELEQVAVRDACKGVAPSKRHNVLDAVALGLWVRQRGGAT